MNKFKEFLANASVATIVLGIFALAFAANTFRWGSCS